MVNLSLNGQLNPVNDDIIVTLQPDSEVVKYAYHLYKNDIVIDTQEVSINQEVSVVMQESGIYRLEIIYYDELDNSDQILSDNYIIDKDKPVIEIDKSLITIKKGQAFNVLDGVKAYDPHDLTDKITTNYDELDFNTLGVKRLVYTVTDAAGNVGRAEIDVSVIKGSDIYLQLGIITLLILGLCLILSFIRSVRLEHRIGKYSLTSLKDHSHSLGDIWYQQFSKLVFLVSKLLDKSVLIKRYSKKYDKYMILLNDNRGSSMDFIATKLIFSLFLMVFSILFKLIQYEGMTLYELIIPLLIGFILPDIIYYIKYQLYRKKMENDLLQAIIIMNNVFKAGGSIIQAVSLVAKELDGPMALEFEKISSELTFGLSIDVVFSRFAGRVNLEEVDYLTSSLTILNKTGGNIVKVFSSIEKVLYNRKRLKLEMLALTGASKMVFYVLALLPLFFVFIISIINPSYFMPFFNNTMGIILLLVMIMDYIGYILVVRKVMQVRM